MRGTALILLMLLNGCSIWTGQPSSGLTTIEALQFASDALPDERDVQPLPVAERQKIAAGLQVMRQADPEGFITMDRAVLEWLTLRADIRASHATIREKINEVAR